MTVTVCAWGGGGTTPMHSLKFRFGRDALSLLNYDKTCQAGEESMQDDLKVLHDEHVAQSFDDFVCKIMNRRDVGFHLFWGIINMRF